jgi:o-succinylbenzoate---CoA ligase
MVLTVNWENTTSYVLMNPAYQESDQKRMHDLLNTTEWPSHCWLSTSGSHAPKWVGLSKQAILISAAAVNQHLESHAQDCWIQALPDFHVGGLGIWARAYLSGASVKNFREEQKNKWSALAFHDYLCQQQGTLTALVPTQLYDLVRAKLVPPTSLRAVIIGGGALPDQLYSQAKELGWPILTSYGSTECASQIATASLKKENHPQALQLLSHWDACEQEGQLCFKGDALFSTYALIEKNTVRFMDPKKEGWWISGDRGQVTQRLLQVFGRTDAVIKICGENVDIDRLTLHLHSLSQEEALSHSIALVPIQEERRGFQLYLASTLSMTQLAPFLKRFQETVLPFEQVQVVFYLEKLPLSPLGKILKKELQQLILKRLNN